MPFSIQLTWHGIKVEMWRCRNVLKATESRIAGHDLGQLASVMPMWSSPHADIEACLCFHVGDRKPLRPCKLVLPKLGLRAPWIFPYIYTFKTLSWYMVYHQPVANTRKSAKTAMTHHCAIKSYPYNHPHNPTSNKVLF